MEWNEDDKRCISFTNTPKYRVFLDSTDFGAKGNRIIAKTALIGDWFSTKGQLISKCLGVSSFGPKNQRNFFQDFCPSLLKEVKSKK